MRRRPVALVCLFFAGCTKDATTEATPKPQPSDRADPATVPATDDGKALKPDSNPSTSPASTPTPTATCGQVCQRATECEPSFPGVEQRHLQMGIDNCTQNCKADALDQEDLDCWAEAPCGAFVGRSGSLSQGACREQRITDEKGESDTTLAKSILKPLSVGIGACTSMDGAKQFKMTAVQANMALDTAKLTSACKLALARAAAKAMSQCEAEPSASSEWIEEAGKAECGT